MVNTAMITILCVAVLAIFLNEAEGQAPVFPPFMGNGGTGVGSGNGGVGGMNGMGGMNRNGIPGQQNPGFSTFTGRNGVGSGNGGVGGMNGMGGMNGNRIPGTIPRPGAGVAAFGEMGGNVNGISGFTGMQNGMVMPGMQPNAGSLPGRSLGNFATPSSPQSSNQGGNNWASLASATSWAPLTTGSSWDGNSNSGWNSGANDWGSSSNSGWGSNSWGNGNNGWGSNSWGNDNGWGSGSNGWGNGNWGNGNNDWTSSSWRNNDWESNNWGSSNNDWRRGSWGSDNSWDGNSWNNGGSSWENDWSNDWDNGVSTETITCTASTTDVGELAATFTITSNGNRRGNNIWGINNMWGWGNQWRNNRRNQVNLKLQVKAGTLSGTFKVILTERSRIESGCSADNIGPIFPGRSQRSHRNSLNPWAMNSWGGSWGDRSSSTSDPTTGVIGTVEYDAGTPTKTDTFRNLPFDELRRYAGRGLALCKTVEEGWDWNPTCIGTIALCCKLGHNNQDAVSP